MFLFIMAGNKSLSLFNKIALGLNVVVILQLFAAYLASYISPAKGWYFGFSGLAYPLILITNVIFIFFWLFQLKKYFLFSLLAILIGFQHFNNTFQFPFANDGVVKARKALPGKRIQVMSYNVRLFDLYHWSHNKETRNKIFAQLKKASADILCLQEFYSSDIGGLNNVDTLTNLLHLKNNAIGYTETLHGTDHWGIAIFTSYPIVNKGQIDFHEQTNNSCIFADVKVNEKMIRVYNVHMQSIRFQPEDYAFLKGISEKKEQEELKGTTKILRRLKIAFVKRARQVDLLAEHIRSCPYPVIICGDFNDTPTSYTYHQLSHKLKDAFVESGLGIGKTYNGTFPSFRIDYILHDPKLLAYNFRVNHKNYSDHYPISCSFKLKQ